VAFSVDRVPAVWHDSTASTPAERISELSHIRGDQLAIVETGDRRHRQITYREIDDGIAAVATSVTARTEPGARIGVITENTIDHLIALFGAQRAGRIAVPLDAMNPPARIQHVVEHAGISLALTTSADAASEIGMRRDSVVELHEMLDEVVPEEPAEVDPASPAQIMYTSGSTGMPKGVVQSHAYLMSRFRSETAFYGLGPDDRLSQFFPISFAASNGHSYGALLNGATLFPYDIPSRGIHHLARWSAENRLTGLAMVPALFRRAFSDDSSPPQLDTVRYVMVGGDVTLGRDLALFTRHFSGEAVFVHRLASTETGSIAFHVTRGGEAEPDSVLPAGKPAPGKEIRLVSERGTLASPGEVGELLVTGTLSEGYWNAPELTADAFQVEEDGRRTYRTGDLARFDERGELIHLGRRDGRIKVRGYGVDITEVERALLEVPGIEEGAVRVFDNGDDGNVLVGYLVAGLPVDTNALRRRLLDRIPEYMVPSQLVQLDQMPLTERGKIDRARLARPTATENSDRSQELTELEQRVHSIWTKVLGRSTVPVDVSFFDLGGNSVGAYKLVGMMFNDMGIDLPASSLLSSPTIQEQARLIERGLIERSPVVVPIRTKGELPAIFGVHGRGGGIVYLDKLADHLDPRFPLYGVQPETVAGREPSQQSVEEMAAAYVKEIKSVSPKSPYVLVGSCFGGLVAWEIARLLVERGDEVALLALVDPPRPGTEHGETPPVGWELVRRRSRRLVRRLGSKVKRSLTKADQPDYGPRYRALSQVHSMARKSYQPKPSPVPLVVLAAKGKSCDQRAIWGDVAVGGLDVEEYPVVHAETWTPWNRKVIAELLNDRLQAVFPSSRA